MGLFKRRPGTSIEPLLLTDCTELIAAVGESFYQPELARICSSERWEDVSFDCMAALALDTDTNTEFATAPVTVLAEGPDGMAVVGHLSHGDALDYRPILERAGNKILIVCEGRIAGHGPGSETSNLGIFLMLPTPERCIEQLSG